jgi:hypothetical protein
MKTGIGKHGPKEAVRSAEVDGDRAVLTVEKTWADGSVTTETVRMLFEDGGWKVSIDIDPANLPPAEKKDKGPKVPKGAAEPDPAT